MVAAALSIAMDQSRDAAMEELMRQREIQAMHAAGLESYIAQKMYVENLQLQQQPGARPMLWQVAATMAHNLVLDLRDGIGRAIVALRMGRPERAEEVLEGLVGEADESGTSQAGSDTTPADSNTSSQPAEPPDSVARSLPDEEGDEPTPDQQPRPCAGCGLMVVEWYEQLEDDRVLCLGCELTIP